MFISSCATNILQDFQILDIGCNDSDHHPIIWSLQCNCFNIGKSSDGNIYTHKRLYKQRWDKADLLLY